jgi:hypothetical protein
MTDDAELAGTLAGGSMTPDSRRPGLGQELRGPAAAKLLVSG